MKQTSKLKPINLGRSIVIGSIVFVVFFSVFAIIRTVMAERTADVISGVMYLGVTTVCLIGWIKSKQVHIIPILLMNLTLALNFFFDLKILSITINVSLLIISIYMFFTFFKHTARYRKILELAAKPIEDVQNGFTERPFPAGKVEYSKGEIHGFAEFLKSQLIAVPYQEPNGIILTIPEDWIGRLYEIHGSYLDETRIIFQYDGQVSAHITEKDYKKYQQELTFDQLCASLGNLFIDFLKYFNNGEGNKIMELLNH